MPELTEHANSPVTHEDDGLNPFQVAGRIFNGDEDLEGVDADVLFDYSELKANEFHDYEELQEMRRDSRYDPDTCRIHDQSANDKGDEQEPSPAVVNDDTRQQVREDRNGESQAPPLAKRGPEAVPTEQHGNLAVFNGTLEEVKDTFNWSFNISTGKNQEERSWRTKEVTFYDLLEHLTDHKESKKKNGPCFMQGSLVKGVKQRTLSNVFDLNFMVLDIDSGQPMAEVRQELANQDLFGVLYTTYSHGTTTTKVKKTEMIKKLHLDDGDEITTQHVKFYLQHHKRYDKRIIDTCQYDKEEHVEGGVMVFVEHDPMPKYRIVLPLAETFVLSEVTGGNEHSARELWKRKYVGLAAKLGASYDRSCTDISRLFFWPTHAPGGEHAVEIVIGDFLRLNEIEEVDPKDVDRANPFTEAGIEVDQYDNLQTPWLRSFMKGKWRSFAAADFFSSYYDERNRSGDKVTTECPFDGGHSDAGNPDDRGFFCTDGDGEKSFMAFCSHDSCADYKPLHYVDQAIQEFDLKQEDLEEFVPEGMEEIDQDAEAGVEKLPINFAVDKSGRYIGFYKKSGENNVFVRVCSNFEVLGVARTEEGIGWSLVIRFSDPEGRVKRERISRGELVADPRMVRRRLVDAGLWVATGETARKFDELLNEIRSEQLVLFARSPGWQAGGFVTPSGEMIGNKDGILVFLENASPSSTRGTLEGSIKVMNAALHSGVAHWQIAPLIAVAGCLISFLRIDSCGLVLTGASSKGKTTALRIAALAWGDPEGKGAGSIVTSLSGTSNSFEATAQRGNGTGVFIDELQHLDDGKVVQQLLFTLAQGEGKARLRPDGTERERRSWRSFYTMTGEIGLLQKIEAGGGKAAGGVSARVVDLDVSNEPDVSEQVLKSLAGRNENFGHYGPAFAEWLAENGDAKSLNTLVRDYATQIANEAAGQRENHESREEATALEKRNALIFGILRLSGELLQNADLLDRNFDMAGLLNRLKKENTPDSEKPIDRALRKLRENVAECWNSSIHPVEPDHEDRAYGKAVAWRAFDLNGGRVFIPRERLSELAGGTVKTLELIAALKRQPKPSHRNGDGWIGVLQVKGKNDYHPEIPGNGQKVSHIRVDSSFFRGDGVPE